MKCSSSRLLVLGLSGVLMSPSIWADERANAASAMLNSMMRQLVGPEEVHWTKRPADFQVDYGKANPILQELAKNIAQQDDLLKDVFPVFDENYTDLNAGRLKYDLTATIDPPWDLGGQANFVGSTSYSLHQGKEHDVIMVSFALKWNTDVKKLFRFAANATLGKDLRTMTWANEDAELSPELNEKTRDLVLSASQVRDLEEISSFIDASQKHAVNLTEALLIDRRNAITTMRNKYEDGTWFDDRLRSAYINSFSDDEVDIRTLSHGINDLKKRTRIRADKVSEIVLSSDSMGKFFPMESAGKSGKSQFTLTDYTIEARGDLVFEVSKKESFEMREDLAKPLKQLISNRSDLRKKGEQETNGLYRDALRIFKNLVVRHKFLD